jgi:hypothetical protein
VYDPVKKLISIVFKCNDSEQFKHCGIALRNSGSLDFFWNYRIVDSFEVEDRMFDGFVADISADFGYLYYKKIHFDWETDTIKEEIKDTSSDTFKNFKKAFLNYG